MQKNRTKTGLRDDDTDYSYKTDTKENTSKIVLPDFKNIRKNITQIEILNQVKICC